MLAVANVASQRPEQEHKADSNSLLRSDAWGSLLAQQGARTPYRSLTWEATSTYPPSVATLLRSNIGSQELQGISQRGPGPCVPAATAKGGWSLAPPGSTTARLSR